MTKRVLIGMLTPSSNTVLEPVSSAMVADLAEVSVHFGRFTVTEISLSERALGQFDHQPILTAARLLADARVDVIAWNGTSSGWLGFEADERLCRLITDATGIPATTSVLALNELLRAAGITEFALVTPYLDDVQRRIVENYAGAGLRCVAERHCSLSDNFSFAEIAAEQIAAMIRAVAGDGPQAITTFCTNMRAAPLVDGLERELGLPIYDTVSVVMWKALRMAGVDTRRVEGWGQLFTAV
jgi:maleate isomerase